MLMRSRRFKTRKQCETYKRRAERLGYSAKIEHNHWQSGYKYSVFVEKIR